MLLIRFLREVFKGAVHILGGLAAGLVIVTLVSAWVLSRGPVSLGFMAPHVSDFLRSAFPYVQTEFDDTVLSWEGWERAIEVRIKNLRIKAQEDTINIQIPELSLSLSTKGLLQGVIAPSSVELIGPTMHVVQAVEENVNLAFAGMGAVLSGQLEPVLTQISMKPDPDFPVSFIERILISDADLIIEDSVSGRSWVTPNVNSSLTRSDGRVDTETSFLVDMGDAVANVSFAAGYNAASQTIDADVTFSQIMPSALGRLTEEINFLRYADVPVHGILSLVASVKGDLQTVSFDLAGGAGEIRLPDPLNGTLETEHFIINGDYDASAGRLQVADLRILLAPDQSIMLPSPVDHSYPVTSANFTGAYDRAADRVEIESLELDLGGVTTQLRGKVGAISSEPELNLIFEVLELKAADIQKYWPASLASNTYDWVTSHVLGGTARNLYLDLEGTVSKTEGLQAVRADGGFVINDSTLLYVETMPPLSKAEAVVVFDIDQMDITVSSAESHGLSIESGLVSLKGLSDDVPKAEIKTHLSGPFSKVMDLIDREPLSFASSIGIDPAVVEGTSKGELIFEFPLKPSLEWDEVFISAEATLENINVPDGLFGLDVNKGMLDLAINKSGMNVTGSMLLNDSPTDIFWRQNFTENAAYRNHYAISTYMSDVKGFADLGIDVSPFSTDMISGEVLLNIKVTENFTGTTRLQAEASLEGMSVTVPAINWAKNKGDPGQVYGEFLIDDGQLVEIPEFLLKTGEFEVAGAAFYSKDSGQLDRIELTKILHGRTEMSGILVPGEFGVWDADFSGPSLDLSPVWEDILYGDMFDPGEGILENISVSTQFDRVWLSEDRSIENMVGAFVRANEDWRTVFITANVEGGAPFGMKLTPSQTQNRRILTAWSSNAGAVLRTFDIYDTMLGGELTLTGHFDDDDEKRPLYGFFNVEDYRITSAPALTKIVSIMSLTGIIDALQGEGLGFGKLYIPFRYGDGILEIREAKATGFSLGFTAAGKVYTEAKAMDISGTIVPVYAVNSLLGNIPILGNIFTGGEEGSGIFAADYFMSGAIDDPEVSVNPLSMLTPGFLRNFFDVFKSDEPPEGVQPAN